MRPDWPILASLAQKTCHFICFRFCECINCSQGFLPLESSYFHYSWCYQASILYKSIASRYLPVSYPDGPITARYRFIKDAYWVVACGVWRPYNVSPYFSVCFQVLCYHWVRSGILEKSYECHWWGSLRKHAYSDILKISPSKTKSFEIKTQIFFIFLLIT